MAHCQSHIADSALLFNSMAYPYGSPADFLAPCCARSATTLKSPRR